MTNSEASQANGNVCTDRCSTGHSTVILPSSDATSDPTGEKTTKKARRKASKGQNDDNGKYCFKNCCHSGKGSGRWCNDEGRKGAMTREENGAMTREENGAMTREENGAMTREENGAMTREENGAMTREENGAITREENGAMTREENGAMTREENGAMTREENCRYLDRRIVPPFVDCRGEASPQGVPPRVTGG